MKARSAEESANAVSHLAGESAKEIGERLRHAREVMGLTQPALAAAAGIPLSTEQKYEGGHRQPGSDALAGYVRAGINANWLLTGEGQMLVRDMHPVPPGALDVELLRSAIVGIDEALIELRMTMPPDRKFELAMGIYEMALQAKVKPARATVLRLVRSAA